MKTTFLVLTAFLLGISCSRNQPAITEFPATLVYDTTNILSMHVYNMEGELDTVDEKVVDFNPVLMIDTITVLSPKKALRSSYAFSYKRVKEAHSESKDTLLISLYHDSIITHLQSPPNMILVPALDEELNILPVRDPKQIANAFTKVYRKSGDTYYLVQYGIILSHLDPAKKSSYKGYTLSRLNVVDTETLRAGLEPNEYLTVIKYCDIFRCDR